MLRTSSRSVTEQLRAARAAETALHPQPGGAGVPARPLVARLVAVVAALVVIMAVFDAMTSLATGRPLDGLVRLFVAGVVAAVGFGAWGIGPADEG